MRDTVAESPTSDLIIWLIGMMGAGKTTVGRILGERLGIPLIDTDDLVERDCGSTIPELWEREGEGGFREREHEAVKDAATGSHIVATGGGVVMDDRNVAEMRRSGQVVFIEVQVPSLSTRVGHGYYRPLLAGGDDLELDRIWADREDRYRRAAHHVVDGEGSPEVVADRVEAVCAI